MSGPDEVKMFFENAADEFAASLPDVSRWAGWVIHLCETLEAKAGHLNPDHPQGIERMLEEIAEELIGRAAEGSW